VPCYTLSRPSWTVGRYSSTRDSWYDGISTVRVHCLVPASFLAQPVVAELHFADAALPIRFSPAPRLRVQSIICTQPWFRGDYVETMRPGAVRAWLHHHLVHVGVDRVHLYDTDGTFGSLLGQFAERVSYFPRFNLQVSTVYGELWAKNRTCAYCAEYAAYEHCLLSNRDSARWILGIRSLDQFLTPVSSTTLTDLLVLLDKEGLPGGMSLRTDMTESTEEDELSHRGAEMFRKHVCPSQQTGGYGDPIMDPSKVQYYDVHQYMLRGQRAEPHVFPHSQLTTFHFANMFSRRHVESACSAPDTTLVRLASVAQSSVK